MVKMRIPHYMTRILPVQLTDNIAITPGAIWITAPDFNNDNDDIVINFDQLLSLSSLVVLYKTKKMTTHTAGQKNFFALSSQFEKLFCALPKLQQV